MFSTSDTGSPGPSGIQLTNILNSTVSIPKLCLLWNLALILQASWSDHTLKYRPTQHVHTPLSPAKHTRHTSLYDTRSPIHWLRPSHSKHTNPITQESSLVRRQTILMRHTAWKDKHADWLLVYSQLTSSVLIAFFTLHLFSHITLISPPSTPPFPGFALPLSLSLALHLWVPSPSCLLQSQTVLPLCPLQGPTTP